MENYLGTAAEQGKDWQSLFFGYANAFGKSDAYVAMQNLLWLHLILTTTALILLSRLNFAGANSRDPHAAPIALLPTYLHGSYGVQEDIETHLTRFTRLALEDV